MAKQMQPDESVRAMPKPGEVRLGLIGAGIQKSLSPALHMQEGKAQGIDCCYELFDLEKLKLEPEALGTLLDDAEAQGFKGLNITHPCKQLVLAELHGVSGDARALNAVNTVLFRNGQRIGHNTDWWGFARSFRRHLMDAPRNRVVQMGAGGAGAAIVFALLGLETGHIEIFDTDGSRAKSLVADMGARFGEDRVSAGHDLTSALQHADGLVNATPMGMEKYPGLPIPQESLRPGLWVADIVYFPLETALLSAARAAGCRTMSGGDMAVFQAVEAFRLFTGLEPDEDRMLRHFAALTGR